MPADPTYISTFEVDVINRLLVNLRTKFGEMLFRTLRGILELIARTSVLNLTLLF